MSEPFLIWNWQRCEELAKSLKVQLSTNADSVISIIEKGKFIYNAKTVEAVHAFLTALEQERAKP